MKSPKKNFILQNSNEQIWNALENKSAFINYCLEKVLSSSKLQEFLKDGTVLSVPKSKKTITIQNDSNSNTNTNFIDKEPVLSINKKQETVKNSKNSDSKQGNNTIKNEMSDDNTNSNTNLELSQPSEIVSEEKCVIDTSGFDDFL